MVFAASPDQADKVWDQIRPHLERFAQETQLATAEEIYADILDQRKFLWLVESDSEILAIAITQVYETMKGRICCVYAAVGTLGVESLSPVFGVIEEWARDIDCAAIEIRGRKGWKKVLEGFKETGVLLEKDLRKVH